MSVLGRLVLVSGDLPADPFADDPVGEGEAAWRGITDAWVTRSATGLAEAIDALSPAEVLDVLRWWTVRLVATWRIHGIPADEGRRVPPGEALAANLRVLAALIEAGARGADELGAALDRIDHMEARRLVLTVTFQSLGLDGL